MVLLGDIKMTEQTLHIYRRVSTDVQGEEGFGLELQLEAGKWVASQLGFEFQLWDEGAKSSTKNDLDNRPVLQELLESVGNGEVEHLYAYDENRLSRNRTTWYFIGDKLIQGGVKLYNERNISPKDLSKSEDAFVFEIMRSVTILEQSQRMNRLSAGKFERVKKGMWQGGPTPFGYKTDSNGYLVKDNTEAKWVKIAFEMYVEGKSILDIQRRFFENGIRTRRGNAEWSTASIRNIISKISHYQGYYTYRRSATDEEVEITCDRIIGQRLFNKARKLFDTRSYNSKGRIRDTNIKHETLLKDFLVCGHCKGKFGQKVYNLQYRSHYYCRTKESSWRTLEGKVKCKDRLQSIKIDKTDKLVWDTIVGVISKSHLFKETVKKDIMSAQSHQISVEEIKKIKTKIKKAQKGIRDINDIIVRQKALRKIGGKTKEDGAMRQVWLEQKEKLEDDLDTLQVKLENSENNKKWIDWVGEFENKINLLQSDDTILSDKKVLLNQLVDKIEVYNPSIGEHELKIKFKLPYVDDGFEWNIVKEKKGSYKIIDGKKEIVVGGEFLNGKKH